MSELFEKALDDIKKTLDAAAGDPGFSYAEKCAHAQKATMIAALLGIGRSLKHIGDTLQEIEEKLP